VKILDDYPISAKEEAIAVPHGYHKLNAYQATIIVYLDIGGHLTGAFPTFLDPGHNHNFSISEQQLRDWAGIDPATLTILRTISFAGKAVPLVEADVILIRNKKGARAVETKDPNRFAFSQDKGIMVHKIAPAPLPILGMRASCAIISNSCLMVNVRVSVLACD
jgi:hypothetical protein